MVEMVDSLVQSFVTVNSIVLYCIVLYYPSVSNYAASHGANNHSLKVL